MAYKIKLNTDFTGRRMGLVFVDGVAETDDAFLATRLKSKGYKVTAEKVADDEKVPEQVEEPEDEQKDDGKKKGGKKKPAPEEPSNLPPLDNEGDE